MYCSRACKAQGAALCAAEAGAAGKLAGISAARDVDIDLLRMMLRLLITRAKALGLKPPDDNKSGGGENDDEAGQEDGRGGDAEEVSASRRPFFFFSSCDFGGSRLFSVLFSRLRFSLHARVARGSRNRQREDGGIDKPRYCMCT